MFSFCSASFKITHALPIHLLRLGVAGIGAIFFLVYQGEAPEIIQRMRPSLRFTVLGAGMAVLVAIAMGYTQAFLYFQF
jgi:hypothetical protein